MANLRRRFDSRYERIPRVILNTARKIVIASTRTPPVVAVITTLEVKDCCRPLDDEVGEAIGDVDDGETVDMAVTSRKSGGGGTHRHPAEQ